MLQAVKIPGNVPTQMVHTRISNKNILSPPLKESREELILRVNLAITRNPHYPITAPGAPNTRNRLVVTLNALNAPYESHPTAFALIVQFFFKSHLHIMTQGVIITNNTPITYPARLLFDIWELQPRQVFYILIFIAHFRLRNLYLWTWGRINNKKYYYNT